MTDRRRHGPTQWARAASHALSYAGERGASPEAIRRAAGLTGDELRDPDARIPLVSFYDLVESITDGLGNPGWGMDFAATLDVQDMDAMGFLMLTSRTLGAAMERMDRYMRLWNDGERFAVERREDRAHLIYEPYGPSRPAHVQVSEMALYDMAVNGERLLARPIQALAVRFRHPATAGVDYGAFGVPVEFGALVSEVVLPADALDIPMPDANAAMCAFFEAHLDRQLEALPDPSTTAARVRVLVGEHLHDHAYALADLAGRLHMSERTLQRRLHDEGTSAHEIVDDVRRERAHAFLGTSMAIAEIAYLLGYSEASAFHRAFKRWTGETPEHYREQRLGAGAPEP